MPLFKKLIAALALILAASSAVFGQGGIQLSPGQVLGNFGTVQAPSKAVNFSSGLPSLDLRNFAVAPLTYSTVCTGLDDTATIQAATDAAGAAPGGTVVFPASSCRVSSPGISLVSKNGVKWQGQGAANVGAVVKTDLVYTSATGSLLKIDGSEGFEWANINGRCSNAAYNGDLIDARQNLGGILTTALHFHDFNLAGTFGSCTNANSLLRVGNTLDVHMHDGFMQMAQRGIYTDATTPTNDFNIHNIWFQNFSVIPITWGDSANWNLHDNISEPLTSGNIGFLISLGSCTACTINYNGIEDGNNLGTAIDLSGGAMFGGKISANEISGMAVAVNCGTSSQVEIAANFMGHASATNGFLACASATYMRIFPNYSSTNGGAGVGPIFTSAGFPANSMYDNNDGLGLRISQPLLLSTPLAATSGGTGKASYAIGDVLAADTTTTLARIPDVAVNNVFQSGGVGVLPFYGKVANAALTNSSTTVNGVTCTLGSPCTVTATAASTLTFGTHLTSGGASYNGSAPITITSDATSANTASTIMLRDGSGQVAATTFTGALSGNANTATNAVSAAGGQTVAIATNASFFPLFAASSTNSTQPFNLDSTFTYNPSTDTLTATNFAGNAATATTASNVTTNANLSGAITSSGSNVTSLGSFSSANLSGALTDETGSGAGVFGTSPTLSTVDARGTWTTGTSWTLPAHTWAGTVAGGGNQLNNVIVGTTTPLAGFFTTLSATTSVTSPIDYGGSVVGSTKLINGTSNGSPASAFLNLQSNGQFASIGNTSPKTLLDINANLSSSPALSVATSLQRWQAADGANGGVEWVSYGPANGNLLQGVVAGGTSASPTATPGSRNGFNLRMIGYNGTSFQTGAIITMATVNAWSGTDQSTQTDFYTTPTGSTALTFQMRLNPSGCLGVGTSTDCGAANFLVAGHLLASGTAPTVSSCGVSPSISGGDNFGTVTAGTGVLSSCVVNFAKTWGTAPRCVASSGTAIASMTVTSTTTQLTIGGTSLTGDVINWVCGSTS